MEHAGWQKQMVHHPWLMVDLGEEAMQVTECQFAFVHPAEGHAWRLENPMMV